MSADNTLVILRTQDSYRVKEIFAAKDLLHKKDWKFKFTEFDNCVVYSSLDEVNSILFKKPLDEIEHGIVMIILPYHYDYYKSIVTSNPIKEFETYHLDFSILNT